jgi:hypothetical protein
MSRAGAVLACTLDEKRWGHDRVGYLKRVCCSKKNGKIATVNEEIVDQYDGLRGGYARE